MVKNRPSVVKVFSVRSVCFQMFAVCLWLAGMPLSQANASGTPEGDGVITDELLMRAEEPFFAGVTAFGQKKYAEAAAKFEKAFALIPHRDLLFNIARCHEQLEDFKTAVQYYERYLATTPVDETAVIHRVRILKSRMGPLGDPPGPVKSAPPKSPAPDLTATVPPRPGGDIPWKYIAVGGGVVSAAVGTWMGMQALQSASDAREASDDGQVERHEELRETALSNAALADISFLITAASAGAAWWLFTADDDDGGFSNLSIGVDGRGLRVQTDF